ncbi:hypothetical protein LINGRAHAP2_LOCUS5445 [Linum grandiflorum]
MASDEMRLQGVGGGDLVPANLDVVALPSRNSPVQTEPDTKAPSHTTCIVGMVMRDAATVIIGADSRRITTGYITKGEKIRRTVKVTFDNQKIFHFGGRFVIGFAGNTRYRNMLLEGLNQMVFPESLTKSIRLIWKAVLKYKEIYIMVYQPKETSLIAAVVGAVQLRSDGTREAKLWTIDDDWEYPREVPWGTCGSGGLSAAKELRRQVHLVREQDDAVELCIRGLYRASITDEDCGGSMAVFRMRAPTRAPTRDPTRRRDEYSPRMQEILAPEQQIKRFYSRNGRVLIDVEGNGLLPRQSLARRRKLVEALTAWTYNY